MCVFIYISIEVGVAHADTTATLRSSGALTPIYVSVYIYICIYTNMCVLIYNICVYIYINIETGVPHGDISTPQRSSGALIHTHIYIYIYIYISG